ncbi:MAG: toll/interleukin-1 receptor domain-containing protein [Deltaproteobacteria bacterium]|nr:toll/interleukin-1 receptor domain-containing protein [Deltaproteobacteria bacterium]
MDKEDLLPGQWWEQEIRKALKGSEFVIIFLSTASVAKRGYVQKEFKLALDVLNEMPVGTIYVIPVRLDDCEVPDQFRPLQWCDLFEEGGFERILQAIREGMKSRREKKPPPHKLLSSRCRWRSTWRRWICRRRSRGTTGRRWCWCRPGSSGGGATRRATTRSPAAGSIWMRFTLTRTR